MDHINSGSFFKKKKRGFKNLSNDCFDWKKGLPPNLSELDVSFSNLDDRFLYELSSSNVASNLKVLKLRETKIKASFVIYCHKFASLEYLDIRETSVAFTEIEDMSKKLLKLKTLKLDEINNLGMFLDSLPSLTSVTCPKLSKKSYSESYKSSFQNLKSLKTNCLSVETLANMPQLERIRMMVNDNPYFYSVNLVNFSYF